MRILPRHMGSLTARPHPDLIDSAPPARKRPTVDVSVERDGNELVLSVRDESGARATITLEKSAGAMFCAAMVCATAGEDFADTYTARLRGELEARGARN